MKCSASHRVTRPPSSPRCRADRTRQRHPRSARQGQPDRGGARARVAGQQGHDHRHREWSARCGDLLGLRDRYRTRCPRRRPDPVGVGRRPAFRAEVAPAGLLGQPDVCDDSSRPVPVTVNWFATGRLLASRSPSGFRGRGPTRPGRYAGSPGRRSAQASMRYADRCGCRSAGFRQPPTATLLSVLPVFYIVLYTNTCSTRRRGAPVRVASVLSVRCPWNVA